MAARRGYRCVSCCVVTWAGGLFGASPDSSAAGAGRVLRGSALPSKQYASRCLPKPASPLAQSGQDPASMSKLAQLVFPPELSAFSQAARSRTLGARQPNQRADVDSASLTPSDGCELICSCSQSAVFTSARACTRRCERETDSRGGSWLPSTQWPSPPARASPGTLKVTT